jgi:aminoglycoside phosphotransferase (APT) family kinase protein
MKSSEHVGLRRMDWRFLFPKPFDTFQHLLLLGGPAGLVERIQEVGLARQVSCEIPAGRSVDAAILLADATVHPADVTSCLRPGALLYWEVNRRDFSKLTQAPRQITHSLQSLGFNSISLYAARPNFDACQFYFPLDGANSFKWFVDTLYVAQTPLQRTMEQSLRLLMSVRNQIFSQVLPYLAVVATLDAATSKPTSFLYSPILPEQLQGVPLSTFIFTDAGNRLVMLPFRAGGSEPEVVVKVPKLASFNVKNQNEQQTLRTIRAQLSPAMCRTIPEPLGLFDHGDIVLGMESYLPGQSLLRSSGRWGVPIQRKIEDLELAARWLVQFHQETERQRQPWGESHIRMWVDDAISAYQQRFGANGAEETLFYRMRQQAELLKGAPFPLVWQHRDFNVWNIIRTRQTILVIDWEGGRLGPPLCDLIHFATHWNEVVRNLHSHQDCLLAFRQLFLAPDEIDTIAAAVHQAIEEYMAQLDLDRRFWPILLLYTWIELAIRRFDQQAAHSEIEKNARTGNRQVEYVNVFAQHADLLFSEER